MPSRDAQISMINRPRIPLDLWRAGGAFIRHKNHPIFTRIGGSAVSPALLLIHGFPTASWDWEGLWPALTARYRVYALDMIGFGLSAKPVDYAYSIADQADLCEAFLQGAGVTQYHALAHDYGDTVAQELLARQNEPGNRPQLKSLCLLNGGLFPETHRPLLTQRLLLSPLGPLVARLTSKATFSKRLVHIFGPATPPDDALLDTFWNLVTYNDGLRVMPKLIFYMLERRVHRSRWVGALEQATIPVKLINGTADPISGRHMVERYRELVPQANVTMLEGIGHYPQCEAPEAVLGAYLDFRSGVVN